MTVKQKRLAGWAIYCFLGCIFLAILALGIIYLPTVAEVIAQLFAGFAVLGTLLKLIFLADDWLHAES